MSRLDLVIGPNGAGKSTFVRHVLQPALPTNAFVNADVIAAQRWPHDPEQHSYDAARVAAATREKLLELGEPFIAETVFSHPSKLALVASARDRGYHVSVHVLLVPEDLSVARVAARVAAGGHSVPETKIRERYQRLWPLVAEAMLLADHATVWDNSRHDGPVKVAQLSCGLPIGDPRWPAWAPAGLTRRWPASRSAGRGRPGSPRR